MANKISKSEASRILSFSEVKLAIENSFGAKKGKKAVIDETTTAFKNRQRAIVKGVYFGEIFLGLNPSQIVEYGRTAMNDTEAYAKAVKAMADFKGWLITKRGYKDTTANTIRGNFLSLFKAFGIRIQTKNDNDSLSGKDRMNQEMGIDNDDKLEILKNMFEIADFEMKTFLAIGISTGLRISDLVKFKISILEKFIAKEKDCFLYKELDKKEGNLFRAPFGRIQQIYVEKFIQTIDDGRMCLFGDQACIEQLMREKFTRLFHKATNNEFDYNAITPHNMRSICKTLILNHGFEVGQSKQYVGKKDSKYDKLTDKQIITIFKAIEDEVNLSSTIIDHEANDAKIQLKVIENLREMVNNEGKRASYIEMMEMDEADLESRETVGVEMAKFITDFEDSIINKVKKMLGL